MKRMLVLVAGVCLLAGLSVQASDVRGMNRIAGTVTDPGGAPVAGVTIKATLDSAGGTIDAQSDDKGAWFVAGMAKGEWSVVFLKPGFTGQKAKVILPADMSRTPPIKIVLKKD